MELQVKHGATINCLGQENRGCGNLDFITIVFLLLVGVVWFFWIRSAIRKFRIWRGINTFNPISKQATDRKSHFVSVGFKYYPVRLSGGMPEFEGLMTINKVGLCTVKSLVLEMTNIKMFGWYLREQSNGNEALEIQISGQIYNILPQSFEKAKLFLSENLMELKDSKYPDEI